MEKNKNAGISYKTSENTIINQSNGKNNDIKILLNRLKKESPTLEQQANSTKKILDNSKSLTDNKQIKESGMGQK